MNNQQIIIDHRVNPSELLSGGVLQLDISLFQGTQMKPAAKVYQGHHFFLIELPICRKVNIFDLESPMSHSTAWYTFPKMNWSVFSSSKLRFTVLLWYLTFTKAFNFNMQLFFSVNTFWPISFLLYSLLSWRGNATMATYQLFMV